MDEFEVDETGPCEQIAGSFCCALLGIIMVPITIIIIFVNEREAVCQEKAYVDARGKTEEVGCTYDPQWDNGGKNNNQNIHFTCDVDKDLSQSDEQWQVDAPGAWTLTPQMQFYGYTLKSETRKEKSQGGTKDTTYTCYNPGTPGWKSSVKRSDYDKPACDRSTFDRAISFDYLASVDAFVAQSKPAATSASEVKLYKTGETEKHAFVIPRKQFGDISTPEDKTASIRTTTDCTGKACYGWTKSGTSWNKKGSNNFGTAAEPGDMRVTFSGKGATKISGVVTQIVNPNDSETGAFTDTNIFGKTFMCSKGRKVFKIQAGSHNLKKMMDDLSDALAATTYILRVLCFFLLWGAFYCCMNPLVAAPQIIPFCGDFISEIVSCMVCVAACGAGCMCWMVWTGLFFVLYRPILGIPMLLVSCGIAGAFWYFKKDKAEDGGDETQQTEMGTGGAPPPAQTSGDDLPPGWIAKVDPNTGATYYCYEETGVTQWEKPTA